jgi:TetR/AcrR family transcriptional repressor of mexJK operon
MPRKAASPSRRELQRAEKRSAIVKVAQRHFREHGFGGTSMSAIVVELGGSKSTLWQYFPSKESLFQAACESLIEDYAPCLTLDVDEPVEAALIRYGHHFLSIILSPQVVGLNRLVIAESTRYPQIGEVFWNLGPRRRIPGLAAFFAAKMDHGELAKGDPEVLAAQFLHLCQYHMVMRNLWGIPLTIDAESLAQEVRASVSLFLFGALAR